MIHAYKSDAAKTSLKPFTYEKELGPKDVLVKVTHCGICHSDVHLADGDWGDVFPLVPGHEVIGTVEEVGSDVKLAQGTRVGIGWQCGSCGTCEWCESEKEVYCKKKSETCMGHFGGFADKLIAGELFCIPIPEELDSAETAPLLCGGVTVFSPLQKYAKSGSKVGIIGIGGLGHMALQFAHAMGCHVTALSTSPDKKEDAIVMGADEFIVGTPPENSFDLIINTAHFTPEMGTYVAALRPEGVFCQVGAAPKNLEVSPMGLIVGSKGVVGSAIGHVNTLKNMLKFAAEHSIKAVVERLPMEKVNEAMEKTRNNKARFRVVLVNE